MARCDCSGKTCNCLIVAGDGIIVSGAGTPTAPFVVSSEVLNFGQIFRVNDTTTVDLSLSGRGTADDPLILEANATFRLLDADDVEDPSGPLNGEVPVWTGGGNGHWVFAAPPPSPPGAVNVDEGLTGDGSLLAPLAVSVSGEWGVGELVGGSSTDGLPIYVDGNGELRAAPVSQGSILWGDIVGKPSTFPPEIGSTSTTAAAGNHTHTWASITGKPTSSTLDGHKFYVQSSQPPSSAPVNAIWFPVT